MIRNPASFRDPSGFIFVRNKTVYRQVNECYREQYNMLMESGLYAALTSDNRLIVHDACNDIRSGIGECYTTIRPITIPFISYPYEWCFSQLKEAALLTLSIAKTALDYGMSLKDCSAYNIQFVDGKPVFIDTLSFEQFREGEPWVAYRQFCQHFLAPLALMKNRDVRLQQLMRTNIDGIPLDLAESLLPFRAALSVPLLIHLTLHARSGTVKNRVSPGNVAKPRFSKQMFYGLIDSLEGAVRKLNPAKQRSAWGEYYRNCTYSSSALTSKTQLVLEYVHRVHPETIWDFGANTACFSKLAAPLCKQVISFDADPQCIEVIWNEVNSASERKVLPLVMDLANPSPAIGWHNRERMSLVERGPADMALCLALIHHLAIGNNVPLDFIARFFADVCTWLVIEFVPKEDPQIQEMLTLRKDIFDYYTAEAFEKTFTGYFSIEQIHPVDDTGRSMYLMKKV